MPGHIIPKELSMLRLIVLGLFGAALYAAYSYIYHKDIRKSSYLRMHGYPDFLSVQSFEQSDRLASVNFSAEDVYNKYMEKAYLDYYRESHTPRNKYKRLDQYVINVLSVRKEYAGIDDDEHPFVVLMLDYARRRKLFEETSVEP